LKRKSFILRERKILENQAKMPSIDKDILGEVFNDMNRNWGRVL